MSSHCRASSNWPWPVCRWSRCHAAQPVAGGSTVCWCLRREQLPERGFSTLVFSGAILTGSSVRRARRRSDGSGRCTDGGNMPQLRQGGEGGRWRHPAGGVPACRCTLASWCLARSWWHPFLSPEFGSSTRVRQIPGSPLLSHTVGETIR